MVEKLLRFSRGEHNWQDVILVDLRYLSGSIEMIFSSTNSNESKKIKIVFDWMHSFRVTDEGDLLKMQDDLKGEMTTGIYTIENSHYLAWFNEQSDNIHDENVITHYLIVTGDDIIDVLSSVSPKVSYY